MNDRNNSSRANSLLVVLMVAVILLLLVAALLPSAQTEEAAGLNVVVQEQLRMKATSLPLLQSVRLTTNNDHRGESYILDSTPPLAESMPEGVSLLSLRDNLTLNPPSLVSDLPCNLCGINNEEVYGNNTPGKNVIYALDVCAHRTAEGRDRQLGRYCVSAELNLFPWKHDGAAQAAAEDKVEF